MQEMYPNLCSPITIGNVTFRNRMFSAPMSGAEITADCCIGRSATAFYELRAKGGAATVTVSEVMVDPNTDGSHAFHLSTATVGSIPSFTLTADAIRRHGAIPSVEFSHSGQYAGTYMQDKTKKSSLCQWGPSVGTRPDGRPVKELTREMIADIVKCYGENARLAKRCGFEMIMVHAGHGWLINQFFSPFFNHRTDEYGGSRENRVRFCIEVLKAIRAEVGPGFPIELRVSGDEFFPGGYDLAECIEICKLVEPYIDLLHVSAASYQQGFGRTHPSAFLPHGCNVYLAAEIKKHVKVPVAAIGGLNDPAQMEEIIASGQADVVYMGRALLADHMLPRKVMANHPETAALRGHHVILCEKEAEVGGILREEQAVPFKYEMYQLGKTLELLCQRAGVELRLNTPADRAYIEREAPDAVILAIGSSPIVPPIPGLDGENVIVANDYYRKQDQVQDTVAVLGGGLAGSELAIHLARVGKRVSLVEMRPELAPDANIRHRPLLLKELEQQNVHIYTSHKGLRVTEAGVVAENPQGEEVLIPGKTVICALGQRANTAQVNALRGTAPYVAVVGDCGRVSNITAAIYQGYHAALDI